MVYILNRKTYKRFLNISDKSVESVTFVSRWREYATLGSSKGVLQNQNYTLLNSPLTAMTWTRNTSVLSVRSTLLRLDQCPWIQNQCPPRCTGNWTLRLRDSSPTLWSFCLWTLRLLVISPTRHFAYWTFRLLPGQFAYRLLFILPTRLPE